MLRYSAFTMTDQTGAPTTLTQGAGALNGAGAVTLAEHRPQGGGHRLAGQGPATSSKIDDQDIVWGETSSGATTLSGAMRLRQLHRWAGNIVWGATSSGVTHCAR